MHGWGDILAFEPQERVFLALAGNVAINNCFNAYPRCAAIVTSAPGAMRVPVADLHRPQLVRQSGTAST